MDPTTRVDPAAATADSWWSGTAMATTAQLCVAGATVAPEAFAAAGRLLREIERELSRFLPTSDVGRLNASNGDWIRVGRHLRPVVEAAERARLLTGGAFDAITGPASAAASPRVRFSQRDGRTYARLDPHARLDLGGIAKGYAADLVCEQFADAPGVLAALGTSSISVRGQPSTRPSWRIALRSPWLEPTESLGYLEVGGGALSISGVSGARIGDGPVVPAHVVDPRTGRPPRTDLCTVGVLAGDGMTAEAWSTAFLVLGAQKTLDLCREHHLDALLLTAGGEIRATPRLADSIRLRSGVARTMAHLRWASSRRRR
ncbi:FAD:protein FMN transferase [Propionicimonas sp.]|uniref:FAD:protein FMN transferase n=1 Tax=Propionicimonas sp. TaxID=1955623 RepID=UPI0039E3D66C